MPDLKSLVMDALKTVNDPELDRDLVSLNMIKGVDTAGGAVTVHVELTTPACPLKDRIRGDVAAKVGAIPGVTGVTVEFTAQVRAVPRSTGALSGVKHVVAVASGKGGVGKSTVAANLALALALDGAKVGLMDLDVMGPSIPLIVGVQGMFPEAGPDGRAIPIQRLGLSVMSWGFFLPAQEAMVVRGPILAGVVGRFLNDVSWGELDYMIIDLPPGTGDIQLTLCQQMPLSGAVVVTTPQDVALLVATKAISMFAKLNTPVLGVIENMSRFICPHCSGATDIFGHGGAKDAAVRMNLPFLGEIPLDAAIRFAENDGVPIVKAQPDSLQAKAFRDAARAIAARISIRAMGGDTMDRVLAKSRTLFRGAPAAAP
ncbi:MAG: Mrp/NBP35 family ATP-binding protein [Candidatus Brocadiae bacterium]|nr:Mrp/NBP35 family ATP-binding protein [Candidatus Brocadiia bacterium]